MSNVDVKALRKAVVNVIDGFPTPFATRIGSNCRVQIGQIHDDWEDPFVDFIEVYISDWSGEDAHDSHLAEYIRAAHPKVVESLLDQLEALTTENARMREAIDFATAPDMWQEQHDGMLDYRYVDWYVDVLNAAIEPKSTDAAIAEIKASELDDLARSIMEYAPVIESDEYHVYEAIVKDVTDRAANLRAGRKG